MKAFDISRRFSLGLLTLTLLGGLAACDNPVDEDHEEHPIGLALRAGATTVASYTVAGTVGNVAVSAGESVTLEVVALGEDGDLIAIDGEELSVEAESPGQGITAAVADVDQLTITGIAAGTHALQLLLYHDGHPEIDATFSVVVQ